MSAREVGTVERRATNLLLAAVVVGAAVASYDRAARGAFDFHHFYLDARYVFEHAALKDRKSVV